MLSAVPPDGLASAQHDVLVPLELRLMVSPTSPRQVLELVTDALY